MNAVTPSAYDETDAAIAAGAAEAHADAEEASDSQALYHLLKSRADQVGGVAEIPAEDQKLSREIYAQAESRSREISALRQMSESARVRSDTGKPIPVWMWTAWILAIVGAVVAFLLID
ncbi:MAG: hypothetical protein ACOCYP_10915 [Planctomycetota bacterium]